MDHFVQQNALLYDKNTTGSSTSNPTSATTEDCEKPTPVNPDPSDLLPSGARMLELDTLGFTNGCVDLYTQAQSWAMFAANNTYNHPIVSPEFSQQALTNITQPGGCMDQILQCRAAAAQVDSLDHATNDTVNQWCDDATMCMQPIVIGDGVSINGVRGPPRLPPLFRRRLTSNTDRRIRHLPACRCLQTPCLEHPLFQQRDDSIQFGCTPQLERTIHGYHQRLSHVNRG